MKWIPRILEASLLSAALWFVPAVFAADTALDTGRIEQLTGLKGTLNQQEGVFKVNFPRKDLQATVGGNRLIPDQGLTAWAAFTRAGDHTMVMGDIVLLEKVVIGRTAKMGEHEVGKEMGINTWAAFAGSEQQAMDLAKGLKAALATQSTN